MKSQSPDRGISLRLQVMLAALDCSAGDLNKTFTAEDLVLAAWKRNPRAWGLRGYEDIHPDSERMYVELDRASFRGRNVRGGLVGVGLLDQIRKRTYRLTPAGLAEASSAQGAAPGTQGKAGRALASEIRSIVSHPVFRDWLKDPTSPKYFRDAGHFWGIAPGTPPNVIRLRVERVEKTLDAARKLLDDKSIDAMALGHGKELFDRADIDRVFEFQQMLKNRFAKDLATLQGNVNSRVSRSSAG